MTTQVEQRRPPRQHPPPSLYSTRFRQPLPPASTARHGPHQGRGRCSDRVQYGNVNSLAAASGAECGDGHKRTRGARDNSTDGVLVVSSSSGPQSSLLTVATAASSAGQASTSSSLLSSTSLPSLLSHLSLETPFSCASASRSSAFAFATTTPPASSSSPAAPSVSPPCICLKRSSPPSSSTSTAHLPPSPQRLKKRKILHRFFRSDALFSSPSSATPSSSKPRLTQTSSTSSNSWWPSVSKNYGEGVESRLGPREEEWTGSSVGWLPALSWSFASALSFTSPAPSSPPPRPPMPNRAASSPAALGLTLFEPLSSASQHSVPQEQSTVPLEGPALKQVLLRNLRARLAQEGGTSKAGEAARSFQKWVVWNSFSKRQEQIARCSFSSCSSSSEAEDDDSFSTSTTAEDTSTSIFTNASTTAKTSEDASMDWGFAGAGEDDDDEGAELPIPPEFLSGNFAASPEPQDGDSTNQDTEGDAFFAHSPLAAFLLAPDSAPPPLSAAGSVSIPVVSVSKSTPRSLLAAPASASAPMIRPGMRRTTSLPKVPSASSPSHSSSSTSTLGWAVEGGGVVLCEG